jgi:hypothetical protein
MIDGDDYGAIGGMLGKGIQSIRRKPVLHDKFNMTWPGLELRKPATTRLSYGTVNFTV